ncbi:4-hydroxy-tetrahydrodipicolinate synthase [Pseudostreptobacillus hongkongensis]|uniref:4-hydroxy-tetrahydrodipicolinate synthase n=1 Tax=Pseudostreptobacillus hongkongensis TaxID=1162717 RepID=UPI0008304EFB|nr:4-hydroxy-tetrahydrodipicolinate synthase [Pseudostreptobacillus hongkongensis]
MKYSKSYVAIVTPFDDNLEVDINKLKELVKFHKENGTRGIVVCGTTGEAATLSEQEYILTIKTVIEEANGEIQVIAGAGSNSTEKAVYLTKLCKNLGVDAVLSVVPYYNKPSQRALINHFKKIAEVGLDVILYNVPSRTGINMEAGTTIELSKVENIVGIKEATGSIEQMIEIANNTKDFAILSGEDNLILPMLSVGCVGVISVTANILPRKVADIFELDGKERLELHKYMYDIHKNMFIEGNPVTIKNAMKILNILDNDNVREPLLSASENTESKLRDLFKGKGLI